ncbi:MAG: hypothetical protein IJ837_00605 [Clostridia bacterium]|nr:hypothetical protein [Clostridia bacterium]
MLKSKLSGYLGLAIRSNSVLFGFDNLKAYKKKVYCVLISGDVQNKLEQHINNLCEERNITTKKLKNSLDDLIKTNNCKVISIINKNFVVPILECEE